MEKNIERGSQLNFTIHSIHTMTNFFVMNLNLLYVSKISEFSFYVHSSIFRMDMFNNQFASFT